MDKPFWKSRKFLYALGTLIAALVVGLLANVEGVSPDVQAALGEFLPTLVTMGALLIAGHTVTDVVATWREGVPEKTIQEAIMEFIEAFVDGLEIVVDEEDPEPGAGEGVPVGEGQPAAG